MIVAHYTRPAINVKVGSLQLHCIRFQKNNVRPSPSRALFQRDLHDRSPLHPARNECTSRLTAANAFAFKKTIIICAIMPKHVQSTWS